MDMLSRIKQHLARLPQKQLAMAAAGVLLLVALYQSALISWQLILPEQQVAHRWQPPAVNQIAQNHSTSFDLGNWVGPFGKAEAVAPLEVEPEPEVTDAPETSLNVVLAGVVASSDQQASSAVIEAQGKQETYGIGDKIRSTNAVLAEVHGDRILLRHRGRLETLMLDGFEYQAATANRVQPQRARPVRTRSAASRAAGKRRVDKRQSQAVRRQLAETREAILEDPGKITDYIRISPVRKQDQLTGYRLNPGKDRKLFTESGLKANDLAVSLNGYDLTDLSQSMEAMAELATMTDVAITVDRDGQLVEILFNLPGQ